LLTTDALLIVNVNGSEIRTQPSSRVPSGPPRFVNVALIGVAVAAVMVVGLSAYGPARCRGQAPSRPGDQHEQRREQGEPRPTS
jgi:hypothetical protein